MTAIIFYIIISSISIFIGYFLYLIFLRKELDFIKIRYYLLFVMVGSLIMPILNYELPSSLLSILDFGKDQNLSNSIVDFVRMPFQNKSVGDNSINYFQGTIIIYSLIALLLACRMIFQILYLALWIFKSKKIDRGDFMLIFNNQFKGSFSFFNWVFINESMKDEASVKIIITHEEAHCLQLHSCDVILAELITVLFWFNPFVWRIKDAVKLNHEYLADQYVLNSGVIPSENYQVILLNHVSEEELIPYVSGLNSNALKNRILMILASQSKFKRFRYKTIAITISCVALVFLVTGFVNSKNDTVVNFQQKPSIKKTRLSDIRIMKEQNRADLPISVQNIHIKRVKTNKKTSNPNQITVENIRH